MQTKTKKMRKYRANTLNRASSSWAGALKMLKVIERAHGTENVSNIIANNSAVELLSLQKGNF